jgi:oxalate decarboxylase
MIESQDQSPFRGFSRRSVIGIGSTLATAALAGVAANAQTRANTQTAERDKSASNPGPENKALLNENPNSNTPPPTDNGDVGPIWYSFDLTHKRIQEGGWTHQVTQRELPSSKEIAGVNMRLTAGSFRELHWHTADEWAIMLDGNARITLLNLDGTIFIDDVTKGDLWYFPAGHPHSIQGLGPDGCEFLLVFNQGLFSEDNTFLPSEWLAHTPGEVMSKNFGFDKATIAKLPKSALYIFPADLPKSLAEDRAAVGGPVYNRPFSTPSRWRR